LTGLAGAAVAGAAVAGAAVAGATVTGAEVAGATWVLGAPQAVRTNEAISTRLTRVKSLRTIRFLLIEFWIWSYLRIEFVASEADIQLMWGSPPFQSFSIIEPG
jgi:hypothetical protein